MDTKQSTVSLFLFFFGGGVGEGVNCLVVFPTYFKLNNSLLKLLHISLLFMFTLVLIGPIRTNSNSVHFKCVMRRYN